MTSEAPVVVVGSGAAGLACALALAPLPTVVVSKTAVLEGGSSLLSQGGIAAALDAADSPAAHALDTLRAGAGLGLRDRIEAMTEAGPQVLRRLIAAGFPADRDADGHLRLGREGAHSQARILHAGGDATGQALVATLLAQAARTPSIELLPATLAVDLLCHEGRVAGLLTYREDSGWRPIAARAVILATGGLGALWLETTNPAEATGDGLAMAARAGAWLADLEFMQFHPTALLGGDAAAGDRLPLLTEALRGAGARLVDGDGRPFMAAEHPLGDLAPRDSVARAIWRRRSAGQPVGLDLRPALAAHGEAAFPQAVALSRAAGYEPTAVPVPVTPAAHYHMGGIATDQCGRSTLPGLWACGEAASTGVHGANRLASNSLLEALVWAERVAEAIRRDLQTSGRADLPAVSAPQLRQGPWHEVRARLRAVMSRQVGIVRSGPELRAAARALGRLTEESEGREPAVRISFPAVRAWSEARNMLLAGRLVALAAQRRTESRGAHFRSDFPHHSPSWVRRQLLRAADLSAAEPAADLRSAS